MKSRNNDDDDISGERLWPRDIENRLEIISFWPSHSGKEEETLVIGEENGEVLDDNDASFRFAAVIIDTINTVQY